MAYALFSDEEAYTGYLTQSYITTYINKSITMNVIVPYDKERNTIDTIDSIIQIISNYQVQENEYIANMDYEPEPTGQYVVITASAHASLLTEDTSKDTSVVKRIRTDNSILGVWTTLYKDVFKDIPDIIEPREDEIENFKNYAKKCILITQVPCGVSGIFTDSIKKEEAGKRELSSREIEQNTIQIFMSKLVDSEIHITNNVMQLIIYFTRHILRETFKSDYINIFDKSAEKDPSRDWYKQIQDIAQTDTAWSSYTEIDITTYFCKRFTCKPNPDEDENYFANYGMHVNLLGNIVLDMKIRNIMTNPDLYITEITNRNKHDMSNPNIAIAINAILSLSETQETNLAELFAIADALQLKLVLFDSGCEYYQDRKYVREHRSGKETGSEDSIKLSVTPPLAVSQNQPPPDSQLMVLSDSDSDSDLDSDSEEKKEEEKKEESWFKKLGLWGKTSGYGGNRFTKKYSQRNKMACHTRKKSRRRTSRRRKRTNSNNRRRRRTRTQTQTRRRRTR
jgi:hypothetical protein